MKDFLVNCPLCNADIPFDSSQCPYCGVLLAAGPSRSTLILKGMKCLKCEAKSYNYEVCDHCGESFVKSCPNCGAEMKLREQVCAACGWSARRHAASRRRARQEEDDVERPRMTVPRKWALLIPIGLALLVALIAVLGALLGPRRADREPATPEPGEVRAVDASEGEWERYGDDGAVVERRFDKNNNGKVEQIVYYRLEGVPQVVHLDSDEDGRIDEIRLLAKDGALQMIYYYRNGRTDLPREIKRYNQQGRLSEYWADQSGDGVWDRYEKYDANGRLVIEGLDTGRGSETGKNGYIDEYKIYRKHTNNIFRRCYDADGDGVIEKQETMNGDGVNIITEEDTDSDGLFDKRVIFRPDTALIREERFDTNGDGLDDVFQYYTQSGKKGQKKIDVDGDGYPD